MRFPTPVIQHSASAAWTGRSATSRGAKVYVQRDHPFARPSIISVGFKRAPTWVTRDIPAVINNLQTSAAIMRISTCCNNPCADISLTRQWCRAPLSCLALHPDPPDRALDGLPPLILSLSSGFRPEVCTTIRRIRVLRSFAAGGPLDRRSRSPNRCSLHASPRARDRCDLVSAVSTSAAIGLEPFAQFSDSPIRDFRPRNQRPRCRL